MKLIPLKNSFVHKDHGLEKVDILDPQINLTLTIVTGSWPNTQLVSNYYSSFGYFTIWDQTNLHLKIQGSVARFAQVFQTAFFEYKCNTTSSQDKCYATTSEVLVPASLKSSILGILGLEQVLSIKPNYVRAETDSSKSQDNGVLI